MQSPKPIKKLLGSAFYTGYAPILPGTLASLVSLPPIYLLALLWGPAGPVALLILASAATYWCTPQFEASYGSDPASMVSDEVAGQSAVFLLAPFTGDLQHDLLLLGAGFLLFRFFDMVKPLGIAELQQLPGAHGVLLDDILAAFYALICLKIIIFYLL